MKAWLASPLAEFVLIAAIGSSLVVSHPAVFICALALVLVKLVLERAVRWPFFPAIVALGLGYFAELVPGIAVLSWVLLVVSALLSWLFKHPAGPPAFTGPYAVAFVDAELVVREHGGGGSVRVLVRALYPVDATAAKAVGEARYYSLMGREITTAMMAIGSPAPLDSPFFSFLMSHLRLLRGRIVEGGARLPMAVPLAPVLVFSHGLTSTREQYLGTLGELASRGFVVLCAEHTDGSCVLARYPDGSSLAFEARTQLLERESDPKIYTRARMVQVHKRATEIEALLAAAKELAIPATGAGAGAAHALVKAGPCDRGGAEQLMQLLRHRLDPERICAGGHSMGGATAIAAVCRSTWAVRAYILFDPAVLWVPEPLTVAALTTASGEGEPAKDAQQVQAGRGSSWSAAQPSPNATMLKSVPCLLLYSDEWRLRRTGAIGEVRVSMAAHNFGPGSEYSIIEGITHAGMSDVPATLPLAISRALGFTTGASPSESCVRMRARVVQFCERLELGPRLPAAGPGPARGPLLQGTGAQSGSASQSPTWLLEHLLPSEPPTGAHIDYRRGCLV